MSRKAAVLLYPGCIFFEIALAAETLASSMEVLFYTPAGEVHRSSTGAAICPSGSYRQAEAEVGALSVVLVPGGDPGSIIPSDEAGSLLRAAHDHRAVLGGICAGALVLASAGLLVGLRATHNYASEFASEEAVTFTEKYWEGAIYECADVVMDRGVVTAMPRAYVEFAAVMALAAGTMTLEDAGAFLSRYWRNPAPSNAKTQAMLESAARFGRSPDDHTHLPPSQPIEGK